MEGRLELRDYQERIITEALRELAREPSLLITAPTGSGKTVVLSEMMAQARAKGNRAALLVHRQELVKQAAAAIALQSGEEPGIVWKSRREWDAPLLVLAQNTVMTQDIPPEVKNIPVLMIDEAHHTVAPSWVRTIERIQPRWLVGFSATPFRQDKEPLSPVPFANVIRPVTPKELIDRGILCPAVVESPLIYNRNGEVEAIGKASNLPEIYRSAVRHAIGQGRGKILLYVSQTPDLTPTEIMKQSAGLLRDDGIAAWAVGQNMGTKKRENAIGAFGKSPGASVLLNYQALTEGTDIALVDCVIVGRHTESESTVIQIIGRGLRRHPSKENCLVMDYSGRPDMQQIIHYWRLDSPKEMGASKPREARSLTKMEMEELSVKFSRQMGAFGQTRVDYAWFRPFDGSPVLALPVGDGGDGNDRYVTVEPGKDGSYRVTQLTLNSSGPTPLMRQQSGGLNEVEAVHEVRRVLGPQAGSVARNAPWRRRPPTERQKETCRQLARRAKEHYAPAETAGDASDYIARARFVNRVKIEALR